MKQGSVCASGIAGIGAGHTILGKTMIQQYFLNYMRLLQLQQHF